MLPDRRGKVLPCRQGGGGIALGEVSGTVAYGIVDHQFPVKEMDGDVGWALDIMGVGQAARNLEVDHANAQLVTNLPPLHDLSIGKGGRCGYVISCKYCVPCIHVNEVLHLCVCAFDDLYVTLVAAHLDIAIRGHEGG